MSRLPIIGSSSSSEDCAENSLNFMLETNKKTKLNIFRSSSSSEEEQAYSHVNNSDCEPNSNQDESSRETALRNPIILRNIMKHFTTNFLLSSCSLVNKTWNNAARIFIRNSRKCVASNPHHNSSPSTCQRLQDLGNLCCKIRRERRQVPFNGLEVELLQLKLNEGCPKGSGCDHQVEHLSEMELKYLEITTEVLSSRIQSASASLICNHASQVKYLTARQSILRLGDIIRRGNLPPITFPNLEEIIISPADELQYKTLQKDILTSILATSPNLTKVFVDGPRCWEIVPQEYYGLLVNLEMLGEDIFDEANRLAEIVCKKPKLRELEFNEFVPEEDAPTLERCKHVLTELLTHCCQESLEYIYISNWNFYTLTLLSRIPLKNLSNLTLEMNDASRLEEFRNALASIQVDKMMPKLEKVELKLLLDDIREWPANNPGRQVGYSYSSVPKLTLDFTQVTVNLAEIKVLFPKLISLEVVLDRSEYVPCREFWELWPNLEVLTVNGAVSTLRKNYDADFCGISEEEAELLRGMDDDYLRTVHIVPIRPSLLTMPHLRTVLIDFHFSEDAINSSRNSVDFISKVTELVALRQISHENAAIIWVCQYRMNEDSEGSDDSDDEEEEDTSDDDNSDDYADDNSGDDDSDDGNGVAKGE